MHVARLVGLVGLTVAGACAPTSDRDAGTDHAVICGPAELVAPDTISTDGAEVRLAIAPDGSRMLWGAIGWEGGAGGLDIWERRRADDGTWLEATPVPFNSPGTDFDPSFAPDGRGVYFFSNRPGGAGGDDLYFVPVDSATGNYGTPQNLGPAVNTSGNEWAPAVSPDGEVLLFASDGHGGRGKHDLFLARRSGSGWDSVEPLGEANGPADDFDAAFLADGQAIIFAVGDAEAGHADLHLTRRQSDGFGTPERLSSAVNAPEALNFGPSVSPARPGVLFFSSHRPELTRGRSDIYRVRLCDG